MPRFRDAGLFFITFFKVILHLLTGAVPHFSCIFSVKGEGIHSIPL